jgi:hypothetical protein
MTTRPVPSRRHLATSPFKPEPEPVIETFEVENRVSHDSYGVGRVISTEASAVTVDFGSKTVRIVSPYTKLEKL